MKRLSLKETRAVLLELGFREAQAAGEWTWYTAPISNPQRYTRFRAMLNVQFYAPTADLTAHVVLHDKYGWSDAPGERSAATGYVSEPEDVVRLLAPLVRQRYEWATRLAAKNSDPSVQQFPDLVKALNAAHGDPDEEQSVLRVLTDALLERGVEF